jgi:hypothetical protein
MVCPDILHGRQRKRVDVSVLSSHDHLVAGHAKGRCEVAISVYTGEAAGQFGVLQFRLVFFLVVVVLLLDVNLILLSGLVDMFAVELSIVRFGS